MTLTQYRDIQNSFLYNCTKKHGKKKKRKTQETNFILERKIY